jgi:hypothetical protein
MKIYKTIKSLISRTVPNLPWASEFSAERQVRTEMKEKIV